MSCSTIVILEMIGEIISEIANSNLCTMAWRLERMYDGLEEISYIKEYTNIFTDPKLVQSS